MDEQKKQKPIDWTMVWLTTAILSGGVAMLSSPTHRVFFGAYAAAALVTGTISWWLE